MFLSITGVTDDNRISKYLEFDEEGEALDHAEKYEGFVIAKPLGNMRLWVVDPIAGTATEDSAEKKKFDEERALEVVYAKRNEERGTLREQWEFFIDHGYQALKDSDDAIKVRNPTAQKKG